MQLLPEDHLKWLADSFGIADDTLVPPGRAVFAGSDDDHVTWLGYRDDIGIGEELLRSDKQSRAARLKSKIVTLSIRPFETPREPAAWECPAITDDALRTEGRELCHDLLANIGTVTPLGTLDRFTAYNEAAPCIVAYIEQETPDHLTALLALANQALQEQRTNQLVLCTTSALATAEALLHDPRTIAAEFEDRSIIVFAREQIKEYLQRMPWVWSKHFGREVGFHLVWKDDEHLAAALQIWEEDCAVLCSEESPRRSVTSLVGGCTTHLIGHPGMGKTATLYQELMRAVPRSFLIVVSSTMPVEWQLLERMVEDVVLPRVRAGMELVFVVDDLYLVLPGREELLSRLYALRARLWRAVPGNPPAVVVTYRTCDVDLVNGLYGHLFSRDGSVEILSLNDPGEEFLRDLVRVRVLDGPALGAERIGLFLDQMRYVDASLGAIVWVLSRYGSAWESVFRGARQPECMYPAVGLADDNVPRAHQAYWSWAFGQLTPAEISIMRLVRCCREYWSPTIPREIAREYLLAAAAKGESVGLRGPQFDDALGELIAKDWLSARQVGGAVLLSSDAARLESVPVARSFVRDLAAWMDAHYPDQFGVVVLSLMLEAAGITRRGIPDRPLS